MNVLSYFSEFIAEFIYNVLLFINMTFDLDKKDKQLLYQLDLDARQNNLTLAKKIGISKDSAGYRIRRLEKKGIIRGYLAIIDSSKLGYTHYRVFLNLIDMPPKIMKELIEFLQAEKNVWWISKQDGVWNFHFSIWVKNNREFREFYNGRLYKEFREHIKDRLICPLICYKQLNRSYLVGVPKVEKAEIISGGEKTEYDSIDLEILKILSKNARTHLLEIAKKLKLDSMTIYRRIKKLESRMIIQGYKVNIDFNILKREFYSVKINLKNIHELKQIENYIKTIPEVTGITEAVGSYDFEFDLEVESGEKYFKIIENIEKKFETIREIIYFRVLKNYKIVYMPEISYPTQKKYE